MWSLAGIVALVFVLKLLDAWLDSWKPPRKRRRAGRSAPIWPEPPSDYVPSDLEDEVDRLSVYERPDLTYRSQGTLLTACERGFWTDLLASAPDAVAICPKVRLADLVIYAGSDAYMSGFRRVSQKHVDFAVIDIHSSAILAVIELDDPSHERPKTQERDRLVESVLMSARIRLLRVPAIRPYQLDEIWKQILNASASPFSGQKRA